MTIVIPAYDEEGRLGPTLERVKSWLSEWGGSFEVLVVDDGSRDRTVTVAQEWADGHPGFVIHRLDRNRGKGAAVREGFVKSRGDFVLFSDADLSTPIEEYPRLQEVVDRGSDFVLGSRALPGSDLVVRQAWYREWMGKTFNGLVRMLTGIPFRDTQCGFKLIRGSLARELAGEMREEGFAFDVELILLASRRGARLRELPVAWSNDERSRVDPVADSARMLFALARIVARTGRYRGRR
ncbi:MAG: dolichyl-phosphate beta-glucosyltransferase [bacterium]